MAFVKLGNETKKYKKLVKDIALGDKGLEVFLLRVRLPDGSLPASFSGFTISNPDARGMLFVYNEEVVKDDNFAI